jgi:protein-S-isoprenylcysteine O-methyltransferase Ste14
MLWLRSAVFTLVLPGSAVVWVPLWLLARSDGRLDLGPVRWVGPPVLLAGVLGLIWCIWDFGRVGRGTLAPVDPPRFAVRSGMYRVVRNPMYISVLTILLGEALLFRSVWLLAWMTIAAAMFHLFVVTYEEPTLRRRFGSDYRSYCGAVPRWLPRYRRPPHVGPGAS